jgi:hypothetical protein
MGAKIQAFDIFQTPLSSHYPLPLKVHKNENFFGFDFEFCTISLLVMSKY